MLGALPMSSRTLRILYLHGFASGPESTKGRAVAARFAELGVAVERLDLRVPSFERLRTSAMIDVVRHALGEDGAPVLVMGSSLGGYVAARVAAVDARVDSLVLLAPAFGLLARWRERLGEDGWNAWRASGWIEVEDHATHRMGRVDFGFVADLESLEAKLGATPEVTVPTLVIHGRSDDVVPIEGSRRWAAASIEPLRHDLGPTERDPRDGSRRAPTEGAKVRLVEVDDGHTLAGSLPLILRETEAFLSAMR